MYTSVLFIYSLQIFGYDSLWYNCSIVIIFIFLVFPCFILLFVLVICAFFHTCMFLMELSLLIKNLNLYILGMIEIEILLTFVYFLECTVHRYPYSVLYNIAVLSELGRFPLYFNIIKGMLLYWYCLENLGKELPLLKEAYNETQTVVSF